MRTGKEKKFKMPEICPVCGFVVMKKRAGLINSDSVAFYCTNKNCPARSRRGLQHFVNIFEIYEIGPKILDRLSLPGTIITLDAMGTQKEIARHIIEGGGDYIFAVKGNQKTLKEDLIRMLDLRSESWDKAETTEAGHGRIEIRLCQVTQNIDNFKKYHPDWMGLKSVARITSKRIDKKTGNLIEKERYYISSLPQNAEQILKCVRAHWAIENQFHWILDVRFREDSCRMRTNHGATNLATIRKIAFNLFRASGEKKKIKRHITTALINKDYRIKILSQNLVNNL
jgi:predicted transposase YbfD/YdcC